MATSYVFNGKLIKIPGSYSEIKSGIKNPPVALPFGNVLVIDTGSGATYGGGAGVSGQLSQGKDSIYQFDNIFDFRDFAKGGLWWLLGQPLFRPGRLGVKGISKIFFIKAATTTPATIQYDFDDSDISTSSPGHGSSLTIKVTDEGLIGNGLLSSGVLTKGFAAKVSKGTIDTSKFIMTFYRGTYKGLDQNNLPFDGITAAQSTAQVVAKSPECTTIQDLLDWMAIDFLFNKNFKLTSSSIVGGGVLSAADYNFWATYNVATGGTEDYSDPLLLDEVLTAVADLDINFILSDKYKTNAISTTNDTIAAAAVNDIKFAPEVYIAGGNDVNDFDSVSLAACTHFDSDSVSIIHGAVKKQSQQGLRIYDSIYHAAAMLGKEAGQEPQVPLAFKALDFDGMTHSLNDKEVTKALDKGLLVTRLSSAGTFDIIKGINSLQRNSFLVNDDGTTASKQIKRIARQLNKEIIVNSYNDLLKDPNGVNRNTLSEVDVNAWLVKYLKSKKATPDVENLIIDFQDIVIVRQADAYKISYKFTPNSEINFLFSTGLIINI